MLNFGGISALQHCTGLRLQRSPNAYTSSGYSKGWICESLQRSAKVCIWRLLCHARPPTECTKIVHCHLLGKPTCRRTTRTNWKNIGFLNLQGYHLHGFLLHGVSARTISMDFFCTEFLHGFFARILAHAMTWGTPERTMNRDPELWSKFLENPNLLK